MIAFVARIFLRLTGWRVDGRVLPSGNYVMIAAPHTSNWDLPYMLAVAAILGVKISWMGKEQIFRWPFAGLMRWLGGIPVRRDAATNMVDQMVDVFAASTRLILAVPPEGTRGRADHWRSGFYHIAIGAQVPVITGYLNYAKKVGGVGPPIELTGNMAADMDAFRSFYSPVRGRRPELQGPVRLSAEAAP